MIKYDHLIVGSHWRDPNGIVWELWHRNARAHTHTFIRPGQLDQAWNGENLIGGRGVDWQWASEHRMNMDGWRAA